MSATHRITAPVAGLNTVGVGGLQFTDSVAETDNPAIIDYCAGAGYLVEPITAPAGGLGDLSIADLNDLADAEGIDLDGHRKSKQTRIDAIQAARQARAEHEALDHTYVITYTDADGDEVTVEYVGADIDTVRAQFGDDAAYLGAQIISVDEKLAGEPAGQA